MSRAMHLLNYSYIGSLSDNAKPTHDSVNIIKVLFKYNAETMLVSEEWI
jgi:hypothetical protein